MADSSSDRRQHDRYDARVPALVTPVLPNGALGKPINGFMTDIGRGGLSVTLPRTLSPGMMAELRIETASTKVVEAVEVRSSRCRPGVGHIVGLRFRRDPAGVRTLELVERARATAGLRIDAA